MAALLQNKSLLSEFEQAHETRVNMDRLQRVTANSATDADRNIVASWQDSYRTFIERMTKVHKEALFFRELAYDKYRKELLEEFQSRPINLLIAEPFLRKQN